MNDHIDRTHTPTTPTSSHPFAVRDFRLLWVGEAVSAVGDQFAIIALPWLALVLTGSGLALGTVLAIMAVPRAVLMLVGGASVDRLSPRRVMLGSNVVRLAAVAALGGIVLAGGVELWMLYAFALVFGIADAFFYPAQMAIVPDLVSGEQLRQANGIVQGTAQLTGLVGPALAGLVIAAFAGASGADGLTGIGVALVLDAATFVVSLGTLVLMAARPSHGAGEGSIVSQIGQGVRFVWGVPAMRVMMLASMGANLLIVGPFEVGMPMVAFARLPEGAAAFGLILAAFGGGSLLGMVVATALPALPPRRFGSTLLGLMSLTGLGMAAIAVVRSTPVILADALVVGAILGYTNVLFITWAQRRIPRELMGRVMSLMLFSSVALVPVSMVLAGVLVQVSLDAVLIGGGIGMTALALAGLLSASLRRMGLQPPLEADDDVATSAAEPAATEPVAAQVPA